MGVESYERYCAERGLVVPRGFSDLLVSRNIVESLDGLLYRPDLPEKVPNSLAWALDLLADAALPPPPNLLPLLPVDDASIACAVCQTVSGDNDRADGPVDVIRWHFDSILPQFQGTLLDSDAIAYIRSVAEELRERKNGLARIRQIATAYQDKYVSRNQLPRSFVTRPVQVACQNVIVGLASFQQDSSFDGLRVEVYLTCEAAHLATHEANRALAALMLCDAFQNGGTMEIRFGHQRSPQAVPPGLRRFARSHGFEIGVDDRNAITPAEARRLFLAVTPMPQELWARALHNLDRGLISPERLCFTLLSPVWNAIELDYLFATSSRIASILEGGADPILRRARLAELEVSRAALMLGVFYRRFNNNDNAGNLDGEARVYEDSQQSVAWSIDEARGVVTLRGIPAGTIAGSEPARPVVVKPQEQLLIVPRALPMADDFELVLGLQKEFPLAAVALLVPADLRNSVPDQIPILVYPDRLNDLDLEIERRLLRARVSRS